MTTLISRWDVLAQEVTQLVTGGAGSLSLEALLLTTVLYPSTVGAISETAVGEALTLPTLHLRLSTHDLVCSFQPR